MKTRHAVLFAAAITAYAAGRSQAASFASSSDLVILQTNGDGGGGGDSVTLLDMAVTGNSGGSSVPVGLSTAGSVNLPTNTLSYNGTSGLGLVLADSSSIVGAGHSGQLSLAQDGHSIELGTYLAPVGTVNYCGTPYSPNGVTPDISPRVITVIGPTGAVTEAATLTGASDYAALEIRQVTSLNGTQFWSSGNGAKPYGSGTADIGGLRFSVAGATSSNSLNYNGGIDIRSTTVYQGQLYGDTGSNNSPPGEHTFSQLGTGLPASTAPAWSPLPATGGGFADGDILGNQSPTFVTLNNGVSVLYESDSTTGGVEKWTRISGRWNYEGEIAFGKDAIENVVSRVNPDGSVSIFSDNNVGTNGAGSIFGFVDTGGAGEITLNGLTFTPDSNGNHVYLPNAPIYTGVTNANGNTQQFWGLSFAPSSSKAMENQIWGNLDGVTGSAGGSWNTAADWAAGTPNASGSTATFGPGLTSSGTITLDGFRTVGHVVFNDSAASYTLAAGSGATLVIDNTDPSAIGVPSIVNSNGSHTITAPISLAAGVTIANQYQASLAISGPIGGAGGVQVYGPGALTISGVDTYTGPTVVHSGPVVVTAAGSLPTTTALTVGDNTDTAAVGLTASITFNASTGTGVRAVKLASLGILSNGSVAVANPAAPASRSVLVLGTLSFAGTTGNWAGSLDLAGNDLEVNGGNLAQITDQVRQGFNYAAGGNWNGIGGITSSIAAANAAHLTAVGVIQNNQDGPAIYTAAHPFDGATPAASAILAKYTYFGDANLDGKVDGSDYSLIDAGYASRGTLTGWYNGDFNYDGIIDGSDYTLIDNTFNNQGATFGVNPAALISAETAQIGGAPATVPEPGSLAAILVFASGLTARQRRRV